jgi:hypothetical protein
MNVLIPKLYRFIRCNMLLTDEIYTLYDNGATDRPKGPWAR